MTTSHRVCLETTGWVMISPTKVELGAASSDHDRACEAFAHLMLGVENPRNVGRKVS